MLVLCRRHKGRTVARMLVYGGWAVSTVTILVIFVTALSEYPDSVGVPWDADNDAAESETFEENDGVETPNRRSLSAEDAESNTALEILSTGIGRADKNCQKQVRKKLFLKRTLSKNGYLQKSDSSFFRRGIVAFQMDSGIGDKISNTKGDMPSVAYNIRQDRRKRTWNVAEPVQIQAPTHVRARTALKIQAQMAKPGSGYERSRNATVKSADISSTDRESHLYRVNKRFEEIQTAWEINDNPANGHLPATQIQMPDTKVDVAETKVSACSAAGTPLVEDGIYWSEEVEQLVPAGITDGNVREFREVLSRLRVGSMEEPQWNRCGRPKNQFVVLEDGTPLCARYRYPQETLIRGEILSFHLSKLLAFDNVPAVVLSQLNASDHLWQMQNFTAAQWTSGTFVALIHWINDLNHEKSRVRMPRVLLSSYESGVSMMAESLDRGQLSADQLTSLLQWTDLILFDYVTGHYDRVASMQDGAERETKPSIMSESIRNLRQIRSNGKLILIDNESGLIDGYELMYHGAQTGLQFIGFHRRLLRSVCVFRRRTVARIRWLAAKPHPERILEEYTNFREPLYRRLKETPEVTLFRTYFGVRLKEVVDWIDHCDSLRHR